MTRLPLLAWVAHALYMAAVAALELYLGHPWNALAFALAGVGLYVGAFVLGRVSRDAKDYRERSRVLRSEAHTMLAQARELHEDATKLGEPACTVDNLSRHDIGVRAKRFRDATGWRVHILVTDLDEDDHSERGH